MSSCRWIAIVFHTLFILMFSLSSYAAPKRPTFTSSEHITIGDDIKLSFNKHDGGVAGAKMQMPNGLQLTYGDIVSFGDFYEIVDQPIAYGDTAADRQSRFRIAFNSFARNPEAVSEAEKILEVTRQEQKIVSEAMARGEKPEAIYKKLGTSTGRQINCITGGGCEKSSWWLNQGRYLKLAISNFDHFGDNAILAYQTGHQVAIEEAIAAGQSQDIKRLELAYAMNAFACHFLTDRFASGHMRTPREDLPKNVTPALVGTLLSGIMHNEESPTGLHVHNQRGDKWIAYGDKSYFEPKSAQHKTLLFEAMQQSANEIFAAYQFGVMPKDEVSRLFPFPDELKNAGVNDISPLFYWDESSKTILRRADLNNLYDRHWTSDWWGWSTLIALGTQKDFPVLSQAALINAGFGEEALKAGLIQDPDMVNYVKSQQKK